MMSALGARTGALMQQFDEAIRDDLNTSAALVAFEQAVDAKQVGAAFVDENVICTALADAILGLNLLNLTRKELRIRPKAAQITEAEIEAALAERKAARAAKDYARSDALRDDLAARGVEVMDGDPLEWDWKLG